MEYKHQMKWTDEKIKIEIIKVKEALCLNRMPSKSEIEMVTGNSALTNKISVSGGFKCWANKLNLKMKGSETSLGDKYEYKIKTILENKGYNVEKMSKRHPYDLLVNDYIKIDVKAAKPYIDENDITFHTFNIGKKHPTCDIYIAIALTDEEIMERIFIIPSKYLKLSQLSVGKDSMYNQYIGKWGYIGKYDEFYQNAI